MSMGTCVRAWWAPGGRVVRCERVQVPDVWMWTWVLSVGVWARLRARLHHVSLCPGHALGAHVCVWGFCVCVCFRMCVFTL